MDPIEPLRLIRRQYYHKEIPSLVGQSKWTLNRELRPHRQKLGKRDGFRWEFEQVLAILEIFGIPYTLD